MKIIKPYGRSHVERSGLGAARRIVRTRLDPETAADIEAFVRTNDRSVITQWVSTIDKIARKPVGANGPTTEQLTFRERLGAAARTLLEAKGLLAGLAEPALKEHLTKFWKVKIAPYGASVEHDYFARRSTISNR